MRADEHIVTNLDAAEYPTKGANLNTITQRRMSLARCISGNPRRAERNATEYITVVTEDSSLANDRTPSVVKNKTPANLATSMYLCPGH